MRERRGRDTFNPYIIVRPKAEAEVQAEPETHDRTGVGSGAQRRAHDRRGHYRMLRSGKRIWINDMKIHGGGTGGRDYLVKS